MLPAEGHCRAESNSICMYEHHPQSKSLAAASSEAAGGVQTSIEQAAPRWHREASTECLLTGAAVPCRPLAWQTGRTGLLRLRRLSLQLTSLQQKVPSLHLLSGLPSPRQQQPASRRRLCQRRARLQGRHQQLLQGLLPQQALLQEPSWLPARPVSRRSSCQDLTARVEVWCCVRSRVSGGGSSVWIFWLCMATLWGSSQPFTTPVPQQVVGNLPCSPAPLPPLSLT